MRDIICKTENLDLSGLVWFLNHSYELLAFLISFNIDVENFSPACRLFPAGTLPPLSESGHPAEESGSQHSGQHPLKGKQSHRLTHIQYLQGLGSVLAHVAAFVSL